MNKSTDDFYRSLVSKGLEPNEYFYLFLSIQKEHGYNDANFNIHQVRRSLMRKGWLTNDYNITDKVTDCDLFKDNIKITTVVDNVDEYLKNIIAYRDIFPRKILPSGKPARSSLIELKRRFDWFSSSYNYDWKTILKATDNYVKHYEEKNYNFMQTSAYFIKKEDGKKIIASALSEWCEQVLNPNENDEKSYEIDI